MFSKISDRFEALPLSVQCIIGTYSGLIIWIIGGRFLDAENMPKLSITDMAICFGEIGPLFCIGIYAAAWLHRLGAWLIDRLPDWLIVSVLLAAMLGFFGFCAFQPGQRFDWPVLGIYAGVVFIGLYVGTTIRKDLQRSVGNVLLMASGACVGYMAWAMYQHRPMIELGQGGACAAFLLVVSNIINRRLQRGARVVTRQIRYGLPIVGIELFWRLVVGVCAVAGIAYAVKGTGPVAHYMALPGLFIFPGLVLYALIGIPKALGQTIGLFIPHEDDGTADVMTQGIHDQTGGWATSGQTHVIAGGRSSGGFSPEFEE